MASGENILTRTGDWLTGNVNGPKLREFQRQKELKDAQASVELADRLLQQSRERLKQLSPVEEQIQLNRVRQKAELEQIPIAAAQADQQLETRAKLDPLDINRTSQMERIKTENKNQQTDNMYANISGLLDKNISHESGTLSTLLGENQQMRDWISKENAVGRAFYEKQTTPDFLDYLGKTAQALAPFLIAFTA